MTNAVETEDGHELDEIGGGEVPLPALANPARTAADVDYLLYRRSRPSASGLDPEAVQEYDGTPTPE